MWVRSSYIFQVNQSVDFLCGIFWLLNWQLIQNLWNTVGQHTEKQTSHPQLDWVYGPLICTPCPKPYSCKEGMQIRSLDSLSGIWRWQSALFITTVFSIISPSIEAALQQTHRIFLTLSTNTCHWVWLDDIHIRILKKTQGWYLKNLCQAMFLPYIESNSFKRLPEHQCKSKSYWMLGISGQ